MVGRGLTLDGHLLHLAGLAGVQFLRPGDFLREPWGGTDGLLDWKRSP
jgi:hypothetical protein